MKKFLLMLYGGSIFHCDVVDKALLFFLKYWQSDVSLHISLFVFVLKLQAFQIIKIWEVKKGRS